MFVFPEFVDFWLNSIHEFCSSTEVDGPPVVLVGTFANKVEQVTKLTYLLTLS
jgi:hypothetical protein